jgi:hypothetical protein
VSPSKCMIDGSSNHGMRSIASSCPVSSLHPSEMVRNLENEEFGNPFDIVVKGEAQYLKIG